MIVWGLLKGYIRRRCLSISNKLMIFRKRGTTCRQDSAHKSKGNQTALLSLFAVYYISTNCLVDFHRLKSRGEAQSAKRGDKNIGLSTKETNRLKKKTDDAEAKVRSLVREKADLQNEKNGLQRQMRGLEKALERLTKDVERKDAVFEKRKETLAGVGMRIKSIDLMENGT